MRGLLYAALTPPWQAPDETGHFEYVWSIAHQGHLPGPEDASPFFERELLSSLYEWRYGDYTGRVLPERMPPRLEELPSSIFVQRSRTLLSGRFSVNYLWAAIFLLPVRQQELVMQLYAARFSSVLLNVGILWIAFVLFSALLPTSPHLALWMTAAIVFSPQHTFVNSTVGDGPLAELMASWVLLEWVRLFRHDVGIWTFVGIALGTLFGIWSKATAAFLLPLDLGLAVVWALRRGPGAWNRRLLLTLLIGGGGLALGLWLWKDSPLGVVVSDKLVQGVHSLATMDMLWTDVRGITFGEALLGAHESFWANFGWMALPVHGRWYGALLLLAGLSLMGWIWGESKGEVPWRCFGVLGGALALAVGIFIWTAILGQSSGYYQVQGRYLFPVLIPYTFFLVEGWERIFSVRVRWPVMGMFLLGLIIFDVWCLLRYLLPYFYL